MHHHEQRHGDLQAHGSAISHGGGRAARARRRRLLLPNTDSQLDIIAPPQSRLAFAAASLLRVSVQQFRVVLSSSSGTAAAAVLDSWLRPARFLQLFPAARGHWCNLPARPTPHARQHTILDA